MDAERSLEGWEPAIGPDLSLAQVVDLAFDYRGNVTLLRQDGSGIEGYVFNRDAEQPEPFLQLFDLDGAGPVTVRYADIRTIRFTGRDTAAGSSYAAWRKRRDAEHQDA